MSDFRSRRYTPEEVSTIVRRALDNRGSADTITYDELVETAAELNISPERLQSAIAYEEDEGKVEAARQKVIKHRREEFRGHLISYCIVNGGLLFINLLSSPDYLWFVWPVVGWGIGLAFHAAEAFFASEQDLDKAARRYLRREEKRGTGRGHREAPVGN